MGNYDSREAEDDFGAGVQPQGRLAEEQEDTARMDAIEAEIKDVSWRRKAWLCRGSCIPEIVSADPGEKWPEGYTQSTARAAIDQYTDRNKD